jgi:hypothetical protein
MKTKLICTFCGSKYSIKEVKDVFIDIIAEEIIASEVCCTKCYILKKKYSKA